MSRLNEAESMLKSERLLVSELQTDTRRELFVLL